MHKQLNLAVDMYGCPNRCLHCWLGHLPNRKMDERADDFIVNYFAHFFEKIAFYSWVREPDYCADYIERWKKDIAISKNTVPQRFELASFYRIVRDEQYIPFLKSVGVKKVQLSFFGLQETQDNYVGRREAFDEVLHATDLLIDGGIVPRWQCFINEENREEIIQVLHLAEKIKQTRCPELEFFVHEGSCDGENRKLYPIRIQKHHIPNELFPFYLDFDRRLTEQECCEILNGNSTCPEFPIGDEITLFISNEYDVYYNFTDMSKPWVIGNLKKEKPETLVHRIVEGDSFALRQAKICSWQELVNRYGDCTSEKVFSLDDYKMYLFNNFLAEQSTARR